MNYDKFLMRGLSGSSLWETIRHRCTTHTQILEEMRNRQIELAVCSKHPVGVKTATGLDAVQDSLLSDITFLTTMAWRLFWFGARSLFSVKPGAAGEYHRAMRQNYEYYDDSGRKMGDYWSSRDSLMARYNEIGCNNQIDIFSFNLRRPCLNPWCKHRAVKEATKTLKRYAHRDWERVYLNRYKY